MNKEISQTLESLKKNNFTVHFFETSEDARGELLDELKNAKSISRGGSVTVDKLGIIEMIKERGYPFQDYVTPEERRASVGAEYYVTGTNAITMDGKLVNIDGCGNRVAAMSYGPSKVFIVCGVNKIVANVEEGLRRIERVAAPKNVKRLEKNTPCAKTNTCEDCDSPERICRNTLIVTKPFKDRITIYLINEELGF